MTFLFGSGFAVYREMENRLQQRNRELQYAVQQEIASREQQAQDLERACEIQRALLPRETLRRSPASKWSQPGNQRAW